MGKDSQERVRLQAAAPSLGLQESKNAKLSSPCRTGDPAARREFPKRPWRRRHEVETGRTVGLWLQGAFAFFSSGKGYMGISIATVLIELCFLVR